MNMDISQRGLKRKPDGNPAPALVDPLSPSFNYPARLTRGGREVWRRTFRAPETCNLLAELIGIGKDKGAA